MYLDKKTFSLVHYWYFILSTLSVWRITHLLGKEDGPSDIIFILRAKAGAGFFGGLLGCFYCLSVWIAFPFGICLGINWIEKILCWLALSGVACLLEQATDRNNGSGKIEYFEEPEK